MCLCLTPTPPPSEYGDIGADLAAIESQSTNHGEESLLTWLDTEPRHCQHWSGATSPCLHTAAPRRAESAAQTGLQAGSDNNIIIIIIINMIIIIILILTWA